MEFGWNNKIGAKLGWDYYGENKLKVTDLGDTFKTTEETYAFPLTVYYKKDNGIKNWSWFAGAGITVLRTNMENKDDYNKKTWKKTKYSRIS